MAAATIPSASTASTAKTASAAQTAKIVPTQAVKRSPSAARNKGQQTAAAMRESTDATLAFNVRRLRGAHRMSVSELARRADLSRQIIYKVEMGTSNLRIESLTRIAAALGVDPAYLLSRG